MGGVFVDAEYVLRCQMVHVKVDSVARLQGVDVHSIQRINVMNVVKEVIMLEIVHDTDVVDVADRTQDRVHVPGLVIVVAVQEVDHAADHVIVPSLVHLRIAASLVPSQDPAHAAGHAIPRTGMEMHKVSDVNKLFDHCTLFFFLK